jgi:hypothetical protein
MEIERARGKGKPILPLLLSGIPFFTLGTLQHDDVRGGRMPSAVFMDRLRAVAGPSEPAAQPTPATPPRPPDPAPPFDPSGIVDPVGVPAKSGSPSRLRWGRWLGIGLAAAVATALIAIALPNVVTPIIQGQPVSSQFTSSPAAPTTPAQTGANHVAAITPTTAAVPEPTVPTASPTPLTAASTFGTPAFRAFVAGWAWVAPCQHQSPISPYEDAEFLFCPFTDPQFPDVHFGDQTLQLRFTRKKAGFDAYSGESCANQLTGPVPALQLNQTTNQVMPSTGALTRYYCESVYDLDSDDGGGKTTVIGTCLRITWSPPGGEFEGTLDSCIQFSVEGQSFRPTPAMLDRLRTLWKTYS